MYISFVHLFIMNVDFILAIVSSGAISMVVQIGLRLISFPLDIYTEVRDLGYMAGLFLVLKGNFILFSTVAILIYISPMVHTHFLIPLVFFCCVFVCLFVFVNSTRITILSKLPQPHILLPISD